ncbi:MAG: hypothetical protein ABW185_23100 [Sedimenticola sp.]
MTSRTGRQSLQIEAAMSSSVKHCGWGIMARNHLKHDIRIGTSRAPPRQDVAGSDRPRVQGRIGISTHKINLFHITQQRIVSPQHGFW